MCKTVCDEDLLLVLNIEWDQWYPRCYTDYKTQITVLKLAILIMLPIFRNGDSVTVASEVWGITCN